MHKTVVRPSEARGETQMRATESPYWLRRNQPCRHLDFTLPASRTETDPVWSVVLCCLSAVT